MIKKVIAAAYKSKGKREMTKSELIHTLSFDLKFFSHDTSKKVVEYATKNRVVEGKDKIKPLFDLDSIEVHPNFKPDVKKLFSSSLFDELVDLIAEKTGKSYGEVVAMINERQEKFNNLLAAEVVALIIAKEIDIDITDYIEKVESEVLGLEDDWMETKRQERKQRGKQEGRQDKRQDKGQDRKQDKHLNQFQFKLQE